MADDAQHYDPPPLVKPELDRLEQWEEERRVATIRLGSPDPTDTKPPNSETDPEETATAPPGFESMLFSVMKEVVFDVDPERGPVCTFIIYGVDNATGDLLLSPALEAWGDDDDSTLRTLALAAIYHVPVFPRNAAAAPELARLQARLNAEGFAVGSGESQKRYTHTERLPEDLDEAMKHLGSQMFISPADAALVSSRFAEKLEEHAEAARLLASLRAAIEELEAELSASEANEGELQGILTRYPILFGVQYRQVIPKHRLGAEYEMDYALVQQSGLVDLVEIEASTRQLFNKKGDPRAELVHAEQQILDWLAWIDDHSEYARRSLPGVARPIGYVVIGRTKDLSPEDRKRLERRTLAFRGSLEVLTYDQLLIRAKHLLKLLITVSE